MPTPPGPTPNGERLSLPPGAPHSAPACSRPTIHTRLITPHHSHPPDHAPPFTPVRFASRCCPPRTVRDAGATRIPHAGGSRLSLVAFEFFLDPSFTRFDRPPTAHSQPAHFDFRASLSTLRADALQSHPSAPRSPIPFHLRHIPRPPSSLASQPPLHSFGFSSQPRLLFTASHPSDRHEDLLGACATPPTP
jgi:hypothetical protein